METQILYSILFTFFCLFLVIRRLSNSKKATKPLPPGPPKLPIIGNLHQLAGSHPHRILRELSTKYGPLMHLQLGETSNVIVSSPDVIKEIVKSHDENFADRPKILVCEVFAYNGRDVVFAPYGNYWRQVRKICTTELFTPKRVQSFRGIRQEEVSALVKDIAEQEGSVMNLSRRIFALTNSVVARATFGEKTKNVEQILLALEYATKLANGFSISDLYPSLQFLSTLSGMKGKVAKVHKELDGVLGDIINDHKLKKKSDSEDLVDVLLRVQENNPEIPLSNNSIKGVILDMLTAGTETSATTTEWAMSELLRNPEVMKKVQAEVRSVCGDKGYVDESELNQLKYVSAVIKETMRLHTPGPLLLPRETTESCEINGYHIPGKTKVIINAWAFGRDPKCWDEPEKFQPERFLQTTVDFKDSSFKLIPFGFGRRICPGIPFALPVLELALANLLYQFDWKLPSGTMPHELDMSEAFSAAVRRQNDLLLVPTRYHP